ncbi:hypothetical protein BC832DRAFT_16270 [Gaertneriomyces semiglobifer]|nr:hypothetical protein BC832DRAFT_16270 [Gaertneriomyces semiglobifer]
MLYLPGDKIVITERIHVLPTDQYDPAIMEAFRGSGFYNDNKNLGEFLTDTAVFDLKTKQFQMIDYIPKVEEVGKNQGYAFCMGHSHLADGSILGAGGDQFWWHTYKGVNMTSDGRRDVRVWTEESNTWTSVAKMPPGPNGNNTFSGRWYPTVITLPDEKAMILGGHTVYYDPAQPLANNPTYEMYHPDTKQLDPPKEVEMLKKTFPINMYPMAHVLPKSGKVWFVAGHESASVDLKTGVETAGPALPQDGVLGRSFPFAASNFLTPLTYRNNYESTFFTCGGVDSTNGKRDGDQPYANCPTCPATDKCYHINPENPTQWTIEKMPLARSQPLAVNLPNMKVALIGGTGRGHQGGNAGTPYNFDPVNKVVIFDPFKPTGDAQRWAVAAEAKIARQYHATAVLRTDGSIVTGGGDVQNFADINSDPYEMRLEVYSPPYMFIPNRPSLQLEAVPKAITYGQTFVVPFAGDVGPSIMSVTMVRYSTVTHTLNTDQRVVELKITKYGKNKLLVESPPDANVAVPGPWMLWAVDNRGAPVMEAATVSLRASNPKEDAAWDEKDTVKPDQATLDAQSGITPAGSGALRLGGFAAASSLIAGAVAALLL